MKRTRLVLAGALGCVLALGLTPTAWASTTYPAEQSNNTSTCVAGSSTSPADCAAAFAGHPDPTGTHRVGLSMNIGWHSTRILRFHLTPVPFVLAVFFGALVACAVAVAVGAGALRVKGLLLAISLLLGTALGPQLSQALPGIATLLTVVGIVIVAVRFGRSALAAPWGSASGIRHIAIAVGFLVLGVILEAILVQQFIAAQGDQSKVSIGLLHALDHTMFVGLMTNVLFGAILVGAASDRPRAWAWADQLIFWGLNIGVAGFVAVLLIAGSGEGAKPFTHPVSFIAPIMGLAALLGIATFSMRLSNAPAAIRAASPA